MHKTLHNLIQSIMFQIFPQKESLFRTFLGLNLHFEKYQHKIGVLKANELMQVTHICRKLKKNIAIDLDMNHQFFRD